jgi:hypothetical protein
MKIRMIAPWRPGKMNDPHARLEVLPQFELLDRKPAVMKPPAATPSATKIVDAGLGGTSNNHCAEITPSAPAAAPVAAPPKAARQANFIGLSPSLAELESAANSRSPPARRVVTMPRNGGVQNTEGTLAVIHECDASRIARRAPVFPPERPPPLSGKNPTRALLQLNAQRDESATSRGSEACPCS